MSKYTDVSADGSSRQHNGNNYNYHYYGAGPQDTSNFRQPHQAGSSGNSSLDSGLKLWRAVKAGQVPRVKYLLNSGADVTYRCEQDGTTPLHQAALLEDPAILEALLTAGASVDDEDAEGATALHYAKGLAAETLVEAGADVDHEDRTGRTPGRRARERSDVAMLIVLLKHHADLSKTRLPVGSGVDGGLVMQGNQSIEQAAALVQQSDFEQAHTPTAATSITPSTTENPSKTNNSNTSPKRRLLIGITLEDGEEEVAYAIADPQLSFGWPITHEPRRSGPTNRPKRTDYGVDSNFTYFGFVLDPDTPGRAGPKAGLIRQQLEATNKTAEGVVALFIRALHNYVVEVSASGNPPAPLTIFWGPARSFDNLESEVVVTVPPSWSEKSRVAVTQAIQDIGLRNVTLIRAAEAAVLYTLHCTSDKHTAVGDVILVCHLEEGNASCTGEQVVSLKPFQLRQLAPAEIVHRRPWKNKSQRKINIPFYHTKTPAQEHHQYFLDQNTLWQEDIRKHIAAQVRLLNAQNKQLSQKEIEVIHFVGSIVSIYPRDFEPLLAGIEEDNPGIKVMHRRRQTANEPSVLGTEVVMYGLLRDL